MFKLIADFSDIETDTLIDAAFEAMRSMPAGLPGGLKLPPFITAGMLKSMPKNAFVETFVQSFNSAEEKMLPLITMCLSPYLGRIRVDAGETRANPAPGVLLSVEALVGQADEDWLFQRMFSLFPDWACLGEALKEPDAGETRLRERIAGLTPPEKEFAALRLMSTHRAELIERINRETAEKGTPMEVCGLRFLMPA